MLNAHLYISLIICLVMSLSLSHCQDELILIFSITYAQPFVHSKFMHLVIICSFPHICVSNKLEGVRIPCCAHCIQIQKSNLCMYLGELPQFICITNLCSSYYFIYLGILIDLNSIQGMRIPCLCILYSNANSNLCTNLGEFPHIIQSTLLNLIIISLFHLVSYFCQLVHWIF